MILMENQIDKKIETGIEAAPIQEFYGVCSVEAKNKMITKMMSQSTCGTLYYKYTKKPATTRLVMVYASTLFCFFFVYDDADHHGYCFSCAVFSLRRSCV